MQIQKILEKAKGVPECQAIKDALVDFLNSKADLSRSYEDMKARCEALAETIALVQATLNNKTLTYQLEVNKFADWTTAELEALVMKSPEKTFDLPMLNTSSTKGPRMLRGGAPGLPTKVDFRSTENRAARIGVSSVKNQLHCGSCWAFSTVGVLESMMMLNGEELDLSEQQLVNCAEEAFAKTGGCDGGNKAAALQWVAEHGIAKESDYPYTAEFGSCQEAKPFVTLTGPRAVQPCQELTLMDVVDKYGPVAVSVWVDTTTRAWSLYKSGTFTADGLSARDRASCSTNHAVLLVGYGTDEMDNNYWIIKNSWGTDWGEGGYIRIARDGGECGNSCVGLRPVLASGVTMM